MKHLPGAHSWGVDDISGKAAPVQANIIKWRVILTDMTHAMRAWWNKWIASVSRGDQLPSADECNALSQSLCAVVTEHGALGPTSELRRDRLARRTSENNDTPSQHLVRGFVPTASCEQRKHMSTSPLTCQYTTCTQRAIYVGLYNKYRCSRHPAKQVGRGGVSRMRA